MDLIEENRSRTSGGPSFISRTQGLPSFQEPAGARRAGRGGGGGGGPAAAPAPPPNRPQPPPGGGAFLLRAPPGRAVLPAAGGGGRAGDRVEDDARDGRRDGDRAEEAEAEDRDEGEQGRLASGPPLDVEADHGEAPEMGHALDVVVDGLVVDGLADRLDAGEAARADTPEQVGLGGVVGGELPPHLLPLDAFVRLVEQGPDARVGGDEAADELRAALQPDGVARGEVVVGEGVDAAELAAVGGELGEDHDLVGEPAAEPVLGPAVRQVRHGGHHGEHAQGGRQDHREARAQGPVPHALMMRFPEGRRNPGGYRRP